LNPGYRPLDTKRLYETAMTEITFTTPIISV
jgi:hypothetical protein